MRAGREPDGFSQHHEGRSASLERLRAVGGSTSNHAEVLTTPVPRRCESTRFSARAVVTPRRPATTSVTDHRTRISKHAFSTLTNPFLCELGRNQTPSGSPQDTVYIWIWMVDRGRENGRMARARGRNRVIRMLGSGAPSRPRCVQNRSPSLGFRCG
ncbi:hypothetical protein MBEHAL_2172 [Halarchaeum acidiphilum MH1-52-1]|uniref:Uncharacterized protein n=1 Tax=Halarchaeum acidiphilum MH1-52-1 TaxID=1261545 RepID=U2YXA7_9EURY|nr:hypothetical protein MBEHAL_2172 [Halarchaeum acidiphilum MH1-52-1]